MKYIKYLAVVLFAGALLTSCGEDVNVGQTTVQFAEAQVNSGFGSGYVYVPITISGENAAAMNVSDVNVKVKVDETYTNGNNFIGQPDVDFYITSCDMVFRNNYEIADEEKENPFEKSVRVEIKLVNTDVFSMEFKLVIESANTTIGAQSECVVCVEKSATDALCGEYTVKAGAPSPFDGGTASDFTAKISWNGQYDCFEIAPFEDWTYSSVYAYWDAENKQMYMQPYEPLMWYDSASMWMCYQMFYGVQGNSLVPYNDVVVLDCDLDNGIIRFPTDLYFGVLVFSCDEGYNPIDLIGRFTSGCGAYVMTKK